MCQHRKLLHHTPNFPPIKLPTPKTSHPDHPEFIGGTRAIKTVIEERELRRQAGALAGNEAGAGSGRKGSGVDARQQVRRRRR